MISECVVSHGSDCPWVRVVFFGAVRDKSLNQMDTNWNRFRNHSYTAYLVLCLSFLLTLHTSAGQHTPVSLNSSSIGSTTGAKKGIFTAFLLSDFKENAIGTGGQIVFKIDVPNDNAETNLEVSTCYGSDFDTYLVLFNRDPTIVSNPRAVSESANDITCATGRSKAFLSTKVSPGKYYILVTGNGVEEGTFNLTVSATRATPAPVPWGLDRIDQRKLPLNQGFTLREDGEQVWIYVIGSGVRITHSEFQGRATAGFDFVNTKQDSAVDCTGHGTHIAGIIAGKSYGIAKKANIVAVRVFGCDNTAKTSAIVDAISWVILDSRSKGRENVVVSLMFNSDEDSPVLRSTVRGIVRKGIPVVAPAGDEAGDACDFYPGAIDEVLSVSSTNASDYRVSGANKGDCTNLYAPGSRITSSWHTSDTAWRDLSGTAQAAAHVVGAVGNLMAINHGIKARAVRNVIESISTKDIIGNVQKNDSTRFLFVRSVPKFTGKPPQKPYVFLFTILEINGGTCVTGSETLSAMSKTFKNGLSLPDHRIDISCVGKNMSERAHRDVTQTQLRAEVPERMAAVTFAILEKALVDDKGSTEKSLGFPFRIIELPWAVDSTPIVFWGAPSFPDSGSASISTGAIAGIVAAVACILAILGAVLWVVYRRVKKLDDIESMEGSADLERGPVHFDDFGDTNVNDHSSPRSFRNVVRAMSFRRTASMKGGFGSGAEKGMNRMGSFIGGPGSRVAKDMVRMQSFGGEAFAGMDSLSRSNSVAGSEASGSSGRRSLSLSQGLSFRGFNNLVINKEKEKKTGSDSRFSMSEENAEEMRMQSLGGEAFAMIGEAYSTSEIAGSSSRDAGTGNSGMGSGTSDRAFSIRGDASVGSFKDEREESSFPSRN